MMSTMIDLLTFFFFSFFTIFRKYEKEDDEVIKKKKGNRMIHDEIRDFVIFYAFLSERKYGLV